MFGCLLCKVEPRPCLTCWRKLRVRATLSRSKKLWPMRTRPRSMDQSKCCNLTGELLRDGKSVKVKSEHFVSFKVLKENMLVSKTLNSWTCTECFQSCSSAVSFRLLCSCRFMPKAEGVEQTKQRSKLWTMAVPKLWLSCKGSRLVSKEKPFLHFFFKSHLVYYEDF